MTRKGSRPGRIIPILFFTFAAGAVFGWWARPQFTPVTAGPVSDVPLPAGTTGNAGLPGSSADSEPASAASPAIDSASVNHTTADARAALSERNLRLPIDDASVSAMKGQFGDRRGGGTRGHEAVDILAPRNTPVHAVEDGTIAKLFTSRQGGLTVYQFDPSGRFCYYYAHLERYAANLREQQPVSRGDIIGYVGTSGNAPPNTPHLHFAIFELTPEKRWWQGTPIDPWTAFSH
jgi:peptidoglycan LD-endopeptidase LytH